MGAPGWLWPATIVGLLAASATANVAFVIVATGDASFAVERDYYRKALEWDATRAQEARNAVRNEGRFNEIQVAGYALYATEKGWVGDPEEISTELSYLVIPKAVRRSVTKKMVEHARSFVARSARDMRALLLDPGENLARLEDFPMIDRRQVCRRCNFRRLCFPRDGEVKDRPPLGAAQTPPPRDGTPLGEDR